MTRRLFGDLVVSGQGAARSLSLRTLPFSLALHAMAVAALATLSITAVKEGPVRASPVVFPSSGQHRATATTGNSRVSTRRPVRPIETRPLVDSRPPAVTLSDLPSLDLDLGTLDGPVSDSPICLTGCTPGNSGSGAPPGSGSGGTGDGPAPVRPGGDIREPRRIRGAVPVYPELARRAHVEGKVVLECVIDTDGRITDIQVVSGPPLLTGAAVDAVRGWVYTPTTLNGQPIRVILTVTVKFGLNKNQE